MSRTRAKFIERSSDSVSVAYRGRRLKIAPRTNLAGKKLKGLTLSRNNLSGSNLAKCDFSGASFTEVSFINANLMNANFTEARLTRCDFRGADLTNANFTRAGLGLSDFTGAKMHGVSYGLHRSQTEIPEGWVLGGGTKLRRPLEFILEISKSIPIDEDLVKSLYNDHPELDEYEMVELFSSLSRVLPS
jgi:uncharacterized protein YjbI with pentapeptide repeats